MMNITIAGESYFVRYTEDPEIITDMMQEQKPKFFTYDTETTGLHLKKDKPFLAGVCFNTRVFIFPATYEMMSSIVKWSKMVKRVYAHNCTYDMHMLANICGDNVPNLIKNWGDTMGLARLSFEAVSARDGGDTLGLKDIGKKYIDKDSNRFEQAVKKWLKDKKAANKKVFTAMLKGAGWLRKDYDALVKANEPKPQEILDLEKLWAENYPEPNYSDVPTEIMIPYLAVDVILTKCLVMKALPVIVQRKQVEVMNRENKLLNVVYKMEREGIEVDMPYLKEASEKLGEYVESLYNQLWKITGDRFTVGQHNRVKAHYQKTYGMLPEKSDKKFLKQMIKEHDDPAAPLISRLRRFEKWKETYVERIIEVASYDGRFYTSLNQFNPVSGRFSGDAQQFPKDPIYTQEGYDFEKANPDKRVPSDLILYHPRRAFKGHIYYLDYSQIELRVQGHYTLYFGGDTNLCRAYMPYQCTHYKTGEIFQFEALDDRSRWGEMREGAPSDLHWEELLAEGWSAWVNPDTEKPWVPTDVHSSTTSKALIVMGQDPETMDKDLFKWWRSKGKQFNFMRNYGGGDFMAAETLDIELEQAQAMNRGYTEAFPVVVTYQQNVIQKMRELGYVENCHGRRYYVSNWNKHYKCGNYLIQGDAADFLKEKMLEIDEFIEENNLETRMILCVHDELQFRGVAGEEWAIMRIQEIMQDASIFMLPIVADIEVTKTYWSEKKTVLKVA
jgi:DNA polymerase I